MATEIFFRLSNIHVLSELKIMTHQFGIKWNFVTVLCSKRISCNRATRYGNRRNSLGLRNYSSINCGCEWVIRFKFVDCKKSTLSDIVMITSVCGLHSNTCDPSFRDQYVLTRTRSGQYKKCTDSALQRIMHQMSIDKELNVRTMIQLLKNVLPSRKSIDRYMINNVRLRALKTRSEMEISNIPLEPCHFDTSFITEFKESSDNYSEGK